jgi:hypothetical protein
MSHTPRAISLPRAYSLICELESVAGGCENENSISFKRRLLSVFAEYGVDCKTTVRSSSGRFTNERVLSVLLAEADWSVFKVLSDWEDRYFATGYDYIAAWTEVQSFQGC